MKMKRAQLATNEPAAAQDLMIKSVLLWFELVHSCGLGVVFERLHGSDLLFIQDSLEYRVIIPMRSIFGLTDLIVHMHSSKLSSFCLTEK